MFECKSLFVLDWLVEALTEHDTEGKYFQLLKFLLHSYLRVERDENEAIYEDEDEDGKSSSEDENEDSDKKKLQKQQAIENNEKSDDKTASSNARAAAAWPMLYQGMALHEITIEPFSLTEVLRLHILSSGVRIGIRDLQFIFSAKKFEKNLYFKVNIQIPSSKTVF